MEFTNISQSPTAPPEHAGSTGLIEENLDKSGVVTRENQLIGFVRPQTEAEEEDEEKKTNKRDDVDLEECCCCCYDFSCCPGCGCEETCDTEWCEKCCETCATCEGCDGCDNCGACGSICDCLCGICPDN
ncbi:unnamed protein product [Allacma fusca]|uniref:Uncharacterized protein n=1 Tax=Allacma fusca TaxID=39272 RepID=A0A8J2K4H7_9HEXA|nr:unnamed protein product [Allacma fusca]